MNDKTDNYRRLIRNLRTGQDKNINPLIKDFLHKIREANKKKKNG